MPSQSFSWLNASVASFGQFVQLILFLLFFWEEAGRSQWGRIYTNLLDQTSSLSYQELEGCSNLKTFCLWFVANVKWCCLASNMIDMLANIVFLLFSDLWGTSYWRLESPDTSRLFMEAYLDRWAVWEVGIFVTG